MKIHRGLKTILHRSIETILPEVKKLNPSQTYYNKTDLSNTYESQSQRQTASLENIDQKPNMTPDDDMTPESESNQNDETKIKAPALKPISGTYQQAEAAKHNVDDYNTYHTNGTRPYAIPFWLWKFCYRRSRMSERPSR